MTSTTLSPKNEQESPLNDQETSLLSSPQDIQDDHDHGPRLSTFSLWSLCAFTFGYNAFIFNLVVILVPDQVERFTEPAKKGTALGMVALCGGIMNLLGSVAIGAACDVRQDKRKNFFILGLMGLILSLNSLWFLNTLSYFCILYTILHFFIAFTSTPYNGILVDCVSVSDKLRLSTFLGVASLGGNLVGALLGTTYSKLSLFQFVSLLNALLLLSGVFTLSAIPTDKPINLDSRNWLSTLMSSFASFQHHNFKWTFITRLLMQAGISTMTKYLQYFIQDCFVLTDALTASQGASLALLPLLVISPIAAFLSGYSIRQGARKKIVYVSGGVMIAATMIFLLPIHSFNYMFLVTSLFGIGYGPYLSVEYAIIFESLPSIRNSARDMALWHMALILPDFFTPLAGIIRDILQNMSLVGCLGYKGVFLLVISYFLPATILTSKLRGIR